VQHLFPGLVQALVDLKVEGDDVRREAHAIVIIQC